MAKAKTEQVKALYELVQTKKAAIANAEKGQYLTDGQFKYSQSGQQVDLKTLRSTSSLVEIVTFLMNRSETSKKASEFLGVPHSDTWLSAPINAWMQDCKIRAVQINIADERTKLRTLEEKLLMLSPSLAQEIELDNIAKALS